MDQRRWTCNMCVYSTFHGVELLRHFVRKHRYDPNFLVRCGAEGCGATYTKWTSYKMHVYRKHRQMLENVDIAEVDAYMFLDEEDFIENEAWQRDDEDDPLVKLQYQAARFMLHVRDKCKVSQKAMFPVMEGVNELVQSYITLVHREIQNRADAARNFVTTDSVRQVLQETLLFNNVFLSVNTTTKLNHFAVRNLQMIWPQKVQLGQQLVWVKKPRVDLKEMCRTGYVIPFLPCLKRLLSNYQVLHCVENSRPHNQVMKSILDGSHYRNTSIFKDNENALGIILYYDELEVVNPLGSKTHKLGIFYWSLANIYPKYRSSLHAVNLYAIAKYCYLKKFGLEKILKEFIDSMTVLQTEGVTVNVRGADIVYKGSLLAVTADTPASALLGGFKRSVSANRLSRRCLTDKEQWKMCFTESDFTLRNMEMHLEHIADITNPGLNRAQKLYWSSAYGVNDRSPLLDIPGFDVTNFLVQDIMHVLSEGVLQVSLKEFLKFCIARRFFTLNDLSERIELFDYGHLSRDKPSSNFIGDHLNEGLRQSASQMVCLGYVMPFLVADKLKGDDGVDDAEAFDRLFCHNRLLQIMNICFAFEVTAENATYLGQLVRLFCSQFKRLYPDALVPKFHFLVHLTKQILEFGPARQSYCMRFEAAHAWFRSLVPVERSFKNIAWTLTYRHEALRCAELTAMGDDIQSVSFLYGGHNIKGGDPVKVRDLLVSDLVFHNLPAGVDRENCMVMISPQVSIHGWTFKPGSIFLLECDDNDLPVFGKVAAIYIYDSDILISYQSFPTLIYNAVLNAYEVEPDRYLAAGVINVKNVIHPHPLSLFKFEQRKFLFILTMQGLNSLSSQNPSIVFSWNNMLFKYWALQFP